MTFQIKDAVSIAASHINLARSMQDRVTDFGVGSKARTLLEAPAIELDMLYQAMFHGLVDAIEVSVYQSFGFGQLPASAAYNFVRFAVDAAPDTPIAVPAGTQVQVSGGTVKYVTRTGATIVAPATDVSVLAYCDTAGSVGNTAADTITEWADTPVDGIAAITNPAAFVNGADLETPDARKARFQAYIQSLGKGQVAALRYAALQCALADDTGTVIERVAYAYVDEPWEAEPDTYPIGLVNVYIHNGAGATSAELVALVKRTLDGYWADADTPVMGWKAAGAHVDVYAASEIGVNVAGALVIADGYAAASVIAAASAAATAYIQSIPQGGTFVLSELVARLKRDVAGVASVIISLPDNTDIGFAPGQKPMPGTIALTVGP